MRKKSFLVIPKENYDEAIRLLKVASIPVTSSSGVFRFDGVSVIIGLVAGFITGLLCHK
jgi:hypothetical protein